MKITSLSLASPGIRLFAWFSIVIQTAFPLAVAFTPVMARAGEQHFLPQPAPLTAQRTQVYTLDVGESAASVAKKYNISLGSLRELNQFRTFAHGFDHLQAGDELDVPVAPFPKVRWDDAPASSVSGYNSEDMQANKVAGYASQVGSFLSGSAKNEAAASMARGMATGAAGGEVQQWLSRFGTARVQLDADKNYSLKNSQLDLLVPLHEQKDSLVFSQGSIHRTDDRTQSNLGFGYRWFAPDWMLGANTFLDYDLSRGHARLGLGGEYWRDFLKLSVNSYSRLTGWKNSPDLEDYEERPANGWDVRAQYWLPSLPQFGGKLTYEQFYGKEVALLGVDSRKRNPHAITAGINYTPVPLITLGAEQHQGQSGNSDTRLTLDMNYQLGVPWRQQVDPDSVAAMRSLAGSRYDLVERNNNIVLEYRKKEVIRLKTADLVKGYAGEQKSLGVSVNSKYGLERIDWSASPLIAAGGKIAQNGSDWTVMMPAYHSGVGTSNTYTVSGVAVDKKGNVSGRADTQITVTQAAIDTATSSLTPTAVTLPTDGTSKQEFVLKVNDKEGRPVDIAANEISVEKTSRLRGGSSATVSSFTRRAAGEYVMTVTSGTIPEAFRVTPSARNTKFASADVKLTADNATAIVNALDIVEDNAIADGKSQNRFRVTVVDAQGNPVPAQSVSLQADNSATVAESAITGTDGTVIVPVTSSLSGETTVTASINKKGSKTLKLSFRPDQNTARIEQKDFSVLPEVSLADGKTEKTVSVRVTDAKGNTVPDVLVTFSADNGAVLAEEKATTDNRGMVTTTMTSTVAGIAHVAASVNSQSVSKETTFTGNNATAIVTSVDTTAASGVADGVTAVTFRALIKDQNGNPLSGIPVDWKSSKDSSIVVFNDAQTVTSEEGIAEVRVTSTRAYSDVVVTASTNASSKTASQFTFVADKQNPVIKAFNTNKQALTANGKDSAELTVSITDTNDNPLSGVVVALTNSNHAGITPSHLVTDANGLVSATLTTIHAGEMIVSASLGKGDTKSLVLTAIPDEKTANVSVTASNTSATAGQAQPVILTATVVDGNNNPVSGTSVAWQTSHNLLSDTVSQTNAQGKATVQLTGTEAALTTVTAVLYNSKKGSAQVTFGPGEPENGHSQLSVSPQAITADGQSKALAFLILRDKWDNPVPGKTIDWSADATSSIHITPVEKGEGVYQAAVTGTAEGAWTLKAKSGTVNLQTPLALLASQDSAQIDSVTVSDPDTARADGQETVTIRVQVKDGNGNTKLKGVAVGWSTTLGALSSSLSKTDENGVAEITLSSRAAGSAWVSAMLGGGATVKAKKAVTFTAGDISADKSSLSISPSSIIASKESATISVTARDAEGNLLPGLKDKINTGFTPDLNMTVSTFSEVSPGIYAASVSSKKAGTSQVSADISGIRINHTASITLQADNDTARVKGSISATPASATVGDVVTYAAVLTDINNNALGAGIPVTWSANEGSTLSAQMTRTDDSGIARVTLSRKLAGTAKAEAILPSGTTPAPDVIFSAGDVDENHSELTLTPSVVVAGKDTATLNLTLRDSNGNLLTGRSVSGHSDNNDVTIGESQENSDALGHYKMKVSSDKAGTATLTVNVDGKELNKGRILTVKGDTDSWKLSAVTPDKTSLTAGDTSGVTYSAVVADAKGNPLKNVVVSWQLRGEAESYAPTSRTNEKGIATTTVKSNTAGLLQMTAYLDADNHIQADNVTVAAGDIKNATFSADKTSIGSDGKDTVTFTTSLEDTYGNPVIGKTIKIEGADLLAGFKLSEVQDQQNGRYVATGTSITKGQVTLSAHVDGKKVGKSATVMAGAIKPDLRFDNAKQTVTWTRSFNASQEVKGMPKGLTQMWSSTDTSVATVDDKGNINLLKSGETNITVFTPGDSKYDPSMASYRLTVNRASPGLVVPSSQPIVAQWGDGIDHAVSATFTNEDAKNSLRPNFSVANNGVVTVDASGTLLAVKPGSTIITVSTPQTDQFEAQSGVISYTLVKGLVNLTFSNPEISTTDKTPFNLQSTVQDIPQDASIVWDSSDKKVVELSQTGAVLGNIKPGKTRVTVKVSANDYYEESSGYYDVIVYGSPTLHVEAPAYLNEGVQVNQGEWKPLFREDIMEFNISSDTSNPYTAPTKLKVNVIDSNNKVILTKIIDKDLDGMKKIGITPTSDFWGKTIFVKVSAVGHENLSTDDNSISVGVWDPGVADIVKYLSGGVSYYIAFHDSTRGTDACRSTFLGPEPKTDFDGRGFVNLFTGGKVLISNVEAILSTTLTSINGDGKKTGEQVVANISAHESASSTNVSKAIYQLCSWNHGAGKISGKLRVSFNGKESYQKVAEIDGADGAGKNKDITYALDMGVFK